jgi:hypothetical protein
MGKDTINIGGIKPSFLNSMKFNSMTWLVALSELCDNSFDAGANQVRVSFNTHHRHRNVEVVDDGKGCSNIERMLTIGDHFVQRDTRLGRYGVGLKEAACWMWGKLWIRTASRGKLRTGQVDWGWLVKQDTWDISRPTEMPCEKTGTALEFVSIDKRFPQNMDKLMNGLGYVFAPAIWSGKQITLASKGKEPMPCRAWSMPVVEDDVYDEFGVNGKSVKLHAGVLPVGIHEERNGFNYFHAHRIIMNTSMGSGEYSTQRICGKVELGKGWSLSKNKGGIEDIDASVLSEEIYKRCLGILEKAKVQTDEFLCDEIQSEVNVKLRMFFQNKDKAKRRPRENNTGAVDPKDTGRRHRDAKDRQPGRTLLDTDEVSKIRMEWKTMSDDKIGDVDLRGMVIYLNDHHDRLLHHRDDKNTGALVDICLAMLSQKAIEEPEPKFKCMSDGNEKTWIDAFSRSMGSYQRLENLEKAPIGPSSLEGER